MWRRRFSPGRMAGDALRVAVRVAVRVADAPRLVIYVGEYSAGRRGAQMAKMARGRGGRAAQEGGQQWLAGVDANS